MRPCTAVKATPATLNFNFLGNFVYWILAMAGSFCFVWATGSLLVPLPEQLLRYGF